MNDTQGHKAGDVAIVTVAKLLLSVFSRDGRCYRIGGDEFFIIQRNIDHEKFDDLLKTFNEQTENHNKSHETKVSVSFGIGYFDHSSPFWQESVYNLFTYIDGEMYKDKRSKKGREGRKTDMLLPNIKKIMES